MRLNPPTLLDAVQYWAARRARDERWAQKAIRREQYRSWLCRACAVAIGVLTLTPNPSPKGRGRDSDKMNKRS